MRSHYEWSMVKEGDLDTILNSDRGRWEVFQVLAIHDDPQPRVIYRRLRRCAGRCLICWFAFGPRSEE